MTTLKAVFAHLDSLIDAIAGLKQQGFRAGEMMVMSPLPRHEIDELLYEGEPSSVRWFTLVGAIFGGCSGFTLCSLTQVNWPMIIPAGKPLVSIPPFIVITFECTVLWGCFLTLLGLIVNCRLPGYGLQKEVQDPRFSNDHFGIVINGLTDDKLHKVREVVSVAGAVEVTEVAHA
jgi:hypothetical protein